MRFVGCTGFSWPCLPGNPGQTPETGRGLPLVEALSTKWGHYAPESQGGKIVWELRCAADAS